MIYSLKNLALFLFVLTFCSCASYQHTLQKENKFNITIGSCFENDTVSILINDSVLFNSQVFMSGFSTGIVPNTFIKYEGGLLSAEHNGEQKRVKSDIDNDFKISVFKNEDENSFMVDLGKGRSIVIDACQSEIAINQYKKKVTFE